MFFIPLDPSKTLFGSAFLCFQYCIGFVDNFGVDAGAPFAVIHRELRLRTQLAVHCTVACRSSREYFRPTAPPIFHAQCIASSVDTPERYTPIQRELFLSRAESCPYIPLTTRPTTYCTPHCSIDPQR